MAERKSRLSPFQEILFKNWFSSVAERLDLDPDPDDPRHFFDYRGFFKENIRKGVDPSLQIRVKERTGKFHFPSKFKLPGHPRTVLAGVNTVTGKRVGLSRELGIQGILSNPLQEAAQRLQFDKGRQ